MERVNAALDVMERVWCEMEPGDALFFHPNTLHCSAANSSEHPRWSLICCYNVASNHPYKPSHHPDYTKLHKVDDSEVLRVGRDEARRASVEFADLAREDSSAKSLATEIA